MNDIEYIERYVERKKAESADWAPDILPGNEYAKLAYNDVLVFIWEMEQAKEERGNMTPKEAIVMIKENECSDYCKKVGADCKDCRWGVAIETLNKQIPMEPVARGYVHTSTGLLERLYCGNCNRQVKNDKKKNVYCPRCGQRIDWSE